MNNYEGYFYPSNDMNYMTGMNSIMQDMNYMGNNLYNNINNSNNNADITNVREGYLRGNMFNNLYDKYKNYVPLEINAKSDRQRLLNQIRSYKFALTDLNLYLDTHPNNVEVINLYNNYLNEEKKLCNEYEKMYGPITLESSYLNKNNWVWINGPWPWEGDK